MASRAFAVAGALMMVGCLPIRYSQHSYFPNGPQRRFSVRAGARATVNLRTHANSPSAEARLDPDRLPSPSFQERPFPFLTLVMLFSVPLIFSLGVLTGVVLTLRSLKRPISSSQRLLQTQDGYMERFARMRLAGN